MDVSIFQYWLFNVGVAEDSIESCILDYMVRIHVPCNVPGSILKHFFALLLLKSEGVVQDGLDHVEKSLIATEKGGQGLVGAFEHDDLARGFL